MARRLLLCLSIVCIFLAALPAFGIEIENAAIMPYQLDPKFIEDIWKEVIRATNEEAMILKVEPDLEAPKIIYVSKQLEVPKLAPPVAAEITYWIDKKIWDEEKIEKVLMDRPRVIRIYPAAFQRYFPKRMNRPPEAFGELAYGFITQEFFHETLLQQYVSPDFHHCAMLGRGTLLKALQFIDRRLNTGTRIADTIIEHTEGQCEKDSGGRIRF